MYSISEVAKRLSVSRQSVYRRLDRMELIGHIHDTEKGKAITDEGLEILQGLFILSEDSTDTVTGQSENSDQAYGGQQSDNYTDSYITSLEEQISYFRSVIAEKDKQIENLMCLTENRQKLLKQEQERNTILIESSEDKVKKSGWGLFGKWK